MSQAEIPTATVAGTVTLEDLTVNRLGYGAARITGTGDWGQPSDPDECRAVLHRLLDLEVNFIDTADSYGPGVSEELIAEALHPYPEGLVIGTKAGWVRPGPGEWRTNGRPNFLKGAAENSLRRLKVDRIDLFQLHRVDPEVPLEESVGALIDLKNEGKIRHIGLCNVTPAQLTAALAMTEIVSVQNIYNLTEREAETVLDLCAEKGVAFLPWSPLATGMLVRPGGVLDQVAARHSATPGQVALAWLLQQSPVVLVIPGTSKVAHLEENVAAAGVKLEPADLDEIEAAA